MFDQAIQDDLRDLMSARTRKASRNARIAELEEENRQDETESIILSGRIRRAAIAAGLTEQDLFRGPYGSLWSIVGGEVIERPVKDLVSIPTADIAEHAANFEMSEAETSVVTCGVAS